MSRSGPSQVEPTDEELFCRFQRGDRGAFATLVRRYQGPAYNFALRHVSFAGTAEEIVQDTFLRVAHCAGEFRESSRFRPWFYAIARHLCIDAIRKSALRRHPSLDESRGPACEDGPTLGERVEDVRASVERAAASRQIGERLARAIRDLPEEQREVFLLREVSDVPFKEIAQIVGSSENTVKSRMRYALERLQSALSEFEEYARALR